MPKLLQRIHARLQKRKARHRASRADNYAPGTQKVAAEAKQLRYEAGDLPPARPPLLELLMNVARLSSERPGDAIP